MSEEKRLLCIHCGTRVRECKVSPDYMSRPTHKKCFRENNERMRCIQQCKDRELQHMSIIDIHYIHKNDDDIIDLLNYYAEKDPYFIEQIEAYYDKLTQLQFLNIWDNNEFYAYLTELFSFESKDEIEFFLNSFTY